MKHETHPKLGLILGQMLNRDTPVGTGQKGDSCQKV